MMERGHETGRVTGRLVALIGAWLKGFQRELSQIDDAHYEDSVKTEFRALL